MYNLFSLFGHIENIKEEDLTHFTYKLDYTLTSTALTIHVRIVIVVQKVVRIWVYIFCGNVFFTVVSSINLSY
jgi:hypothetical protein